MNDKANGNHEPAEESIPKPAQVAAPKTVQKKTPKKAIKNQKEKVGKTNMKKAKAPKKGKKGPFKFIPKEGRVFGKYLLTGAKGKIAHEAQRNRKITVERAQKIAGKKRAEPMLYRI